MLALGAVYYFFVHKHMRKQLDRTDGSTGSSSPEA